MDIALLVGIVVEVTVLTAGSALVIGRLLHLQGINKRSALLIGGLWGAVRGLSEIIDGRAAQTPFALLVLFVVWIAFYIGAVKVILRLRPMKAILTTLAIAITTALLSIPIALAGRLSVVAPFRIASEAMTPTLHQGDVVLVNRWAYCLRDPRRFDIITFRSPRDARRQELKRVVGLPHERLEIREGMVLIDGDAVSLPPALAGARWDNQGDYGSPGRPYEIPDDCYFMLGDNSAKSYDSRLFGCVPKIAVLGRAYFCLSPPERRRVL